MGLFWQNFSQISTRILIPRPTTPKINHMKSKIIGLCIALAIVILIIVGVNGENSRNNGGIIKIGLMAPLSGEYSTAGENLVKGANVAMDAYSKAHPNLKIQLVVEDDGFNVAKGVSAYKKLSGIDKVDAFITVSTPVIDAIHSEITKTDVPVMQIGIQTVGIGPDNIFQNSPAAADGIIALANYSTNKFNFSKLAIVYDTTPGGTIFFNVFKENYQKISEDFSITKKDEVRGYANKIVNGKFDGVVMLNSPENGALLTKELLRLGYKGQLIYDAQLQTGFADYKRILGNTKVIDGAISIWFKDGDKSEFVKQYNEKYSADPGFWTEFGYDSFNTLINAYSINNGEWLKNIQNTNTIGASGKIAFDKDGIRKQDISINQVKDGEIVSIEVVEVK